jgi:XTP/dITP diphosphohydrolase
VSGAPDQSVPPLERAVAVMDRLRSPGGCPWDAEQTPRSLARYLLEETYEVLEAIETDDPALLREELGDLLLQVLFHARLAEELPPGERFTIEDVAADLVDKLVRRHPHVFADGDASDADTVNERWESQKIAEKGRRSAVDGVPLAQPALALAAKLVARAERAGLAVKAPTEDEPAEDEIGRRLFAVVQDAVSAGVDPEGALRRTTLAYRRAIMAAERSLS